MGLKEMQPQAKSVLMVRTTHWEGKGLKVTPPPSTGHMTQDPGDPSRWTWDMASMALLSQDTMFWSLWKL